VIPCSPPAHRPYRGILGHVRRHAVARSTDCNPHVGTGIAKALKAGLLGAGLAGGAIGAGAAGWAASGLLVPSAQGWPATPAATVRHGEPVPPCDVPEPWGAAVLAVGVAGLVWVRRRMPQQRE